MERATSLTCALAAQTFMVEKGIKKQTLCNSRGRAPVRLSAPMQCAQSKRTAPHVRIMFSRKWHALEGSQTAELELMLSVVPVVTWLKSSIPNAACAVAIDYMHRCNKARRSTGVFVKSCVAHLWPRRAQRWS